MTRHQPEPEPQRHPEPADSRGPASPAEAAPAPDPDLPAGAAVEAEGIGLKGPRGWVFREVTVEAAPGSVVALTGASGTGRTCLLLALTGRMKLTEGEARIGGLRLRKQAAAVRRTAALAHVPGVDDLEPSLTVGEHLRERVLLQRRYGTAPLAALKAALRPPRQRRADARRVHDEALEATGLDLATLPKGPRTAVRDLERLERLRLCVALALIGRPRLIAVDDVDLKLSAPLREEAWALLASVAASGVTVLAVCGEPPTGLPGDVPLVVVVTDRATGARTAEDAEPARKTDGTDETENEKETADALAETGRA
ncbi:MULTISPECIES: ATP-binding cassette domain-containing protein [Streptomyces]|uniref:ATP-binding cassette domain-containing protein n=1 Tax=Streptomyces odorifer TaxID=53450 RepID=A0A7Y6CAV2_9ACTN|nr:ATP-binding cassette domain-containing protein [Streptomyces odorifer]NUV30138.1 ATP-binding cassette domain-containing protein [Streptomyces odorifer]NUV32669.1 ATP-binding cassette domain-containing protein [Streptomyces sp. KAI-27]NUV45982.1 ATP-binding cassette domain-containing protein [Streptomyces sp. CAI-78]